MAPLRAVYAARSSVRATIPVKIVTDAILGLRVKSRASPSSDRDVVAVTEAVVARSQGNYAGVEDIAADCRAKFGADPVALHIPILSRNRIAICLEGIAKAFKKVYILMSYPLRRGGKPSVRRGPAG